MQMQINCISWFWWVERNQALEQFCKRMGFSESGVSICTVIVFSWVLADPDAGNVIELIQILEKLLSQSMSMNFRWYHGERFGPTQGFE